MGAFITVSKHSVQTGQWALLVRPRRSNFHVRRDKAALLQRVQGAPGTASTGSNRGRHGGDEMSEALG